MAPGSAEGAEGCGEGLLYCVGDLVIGAAGVLGEWREGDGKGAGGQIGRGRPAVGDGEDDGALEEELERLAVAWLAVGDTDAAGEAAEGVGDLRGEGGDVVEGEDPVEAGAREELAGGGGKRGEGRGGGIDDRPEGAGGEGFAAAGRTTEDEDGIGAVCAEGGEEPGQAAEPTGGTWGAEVKGGAEGVEGWMGWLAVGLFGGGEGGGGGGSFEGDAFAGGYGPALGGDFDELAFGVGEVEEDFFGRGEGAAAVDAVGDADIAVLGIAGGLRFQVMEDGVEGVGGGDGVVEGEALVEDPLTEGAGANGEGEMAAGLGGHGDEGASAEGSEGGAAFGDAEEGVEAGWTAGSWWGTHKNSLHFDV